MFSPYGKTKRCYYLKATMQRKQEPHGFGITMTIVSVTTSYTVVCASETSPNHPQALAVRRAFGQ